jgi:hypothetical protein
LEKSALGFGKGKPIEYLLCQIHGAVVSGCEVSLTWPSKMPNSEHGTFLSKYLRTIDNRS